MKPCPFCADDNPQVVLLDEKQNWHAAHCLHCGAYGPSAGNADDAKKYWDDREDELEPAEKYSIPYSLEDDPYVVGSPSNDTQPGLILLLVIVVCFIMGAYAWLH